MGHTKKRLAAGSRCLLSAFLSGVGRFACQTPSVMFVSARALLAWLCQECYRAVAHATGGAQCCNDRCDDAADDLEDGLPRFLVVLHDVRWFFRG